MRRPGADVGNAKKKTGVFFDKMFVGPFPACWFFTGQEGERFLRSQALAVMAGDIPEQVLNCFGGILAQRKQRLPDRLFPELPEMWMDLLPG